MDPFCGNFHRINFSFSNRTHPDCAFCMLDDCQKPIQKIQLRKDGPWCNITSIYNENTQFLIRSPKIAWTAAAMNPSEILPFQTLLFISFEILSNLTPFKCPHNLHGSISTNFNLSCDDSFIYCNHPNENLPCLPLQRSLIQLPVNKTPWNSASLFNLLTSRFSVKLPANRPQEANIRDFVGREPMSDW